MLTAIHSLLYFTLLYFIVSSFTGIRLNRSAGEIDFVTFMAAGTFETKATET